MSMNQQQALRKLETFVTQTAASAKVLQDINCITQGLIVLYSAIDTMAWLDVEADNVTRSDFKAWADGYMLQVTLSQRNAVLACSSEELYAARCGLLHSHTAESKLSRDRGVREFYYLGKFPTEAEVRSRLGIGPNIVFMRFPDLVEAFVMGAIRFSEELEADAARLARVAPRLQKMLAWFPPEFVNQSGPNPDIDAGA